MWSEINLIKNSIGEFAEIKRRVAALSRLPSEGDFNTLKTRIDMLETYQNSSRRKVEDHDKKIKGLMEKAV